MRTSSTGVTLRDTVTGETRELPATGLFIAIGHDPRSELVTGQVDLDEEGYVLVKTADTETNLPGVLRLPATWWTTPTGRRSPPPAPAVRPPWTPSASWPPSSTPRRPRPPPDASAATTQPVSV